jgi:hypothetical protein
MFPSAVLLSSISFVITTCGFPEWLLLQLLLPRGAQIFTRLF